MPQEVHNPGPVVSLYVPAEQAVQAAEPVTVLNVPFGHSVHATPFAPVYPIIQVQRERRLLPTVDSVLLGQARHLASYVAVVVVE